MDVVSILGNIGGAITGMFGRGRRQADIVTHAYDNGIRALLDGIIYGTLTRGASPADLGRLKQDLQYAQNWWRDNVLSKITDDRVLPTAQFIYSGHEQNDLYGISSFPFAWDYLNLAISKTGAVPVAPSASPSSGLPVQVVPVDPGFFDFSISTPTFVSQQPTRSWDQVLTEAVQQAASRAARRSTPAPAAAAPAQLPGWVLPAAAVAGLWLLFGRSGR